MTRLLRALVALASTLLAALALAPLTSVSAFDGNPAGDVLQFDTAFANVAPFIGANGKIRDVPAAPLPWKIRAIHGDLDANGMLTVDVDNLVLVATGTNPVPSFAAIVSCETSVNNKVAVSNVTSADFRATPQGNAFIHQRLSLPHPCAAPDVFITAPKGAVWFAATGTVGKSGRDVLQFDTMFANVAPFITPAAISGVTAAPLPWHINHEIRGDLDANGNLSIDVDGLVLANDPSVPAQFRNTNPVPFFSAVVTCRTASGNNVVTTRTNSANFPASTQGNARIRARLSLPSPCVTPYVFVTSPNPNGVFFAVTGR
jgi:hypothetical protein